MGYEGSRLWVGDILVGEPQNAGGTLVGILRAVAAERAPKGSLKLGRLDWDELEDDRLRDNSGVVKYPFVSICTLRRNESSPIIALSSTSPLIGN
jgi:hypothetical protein